MLERAIFCKVGEVVGNYRGLSLRSNAYWQVERETEAQKGEKQERGGRREGRGRERERDSSAEKTTGGGDRREGKEGFRRDTRGATESLSNVEIVVSKISQSVPKQWEWQGEGVDRSEPMRWVRKWFGATLSLRFRRNQPPSQSIDLLDTRSTYTIDLSTRTCPLPLCSSSFRWSTSDAISRLIYHPSTEIWTREEIK